jgi:hypothetical protein
MAAEYLSKSCPTEIPSHPVARLKFMEGQIDSMLMALEIVHQPLRGFEQSLTDNQRARIAATALTPNTADAGQPKIHSNIATTCSATPRTTNWPIGMFEQVQPTDTQRGALNEVRQAFGRAASNLNAQCATSLPPTALARLARKSHTIFA